MENHEIKYLKSILRYHQETGSFYWTENARRNIGKVAGSIQWKGKTGYIYIRHKGKPYLAHRLAYAFINGFWPNGDLDHINGDGLDNRIENLRIVSHRMNMENRHQPHKNNKCGFMGVYKEKKCKSFRAVIKVNGKNNHLGSFASAEEAHFAYLAAKRMLHVGCTI